MTVRQHLHYILHCFHFSAKSDSGIADSACISVFLLYLLYVLCSPNRPYSSCHSMFVLQSLPDFLNASRDFLGSSPAFPVLLLVFMFRIYCIYNDFSRLLNHDWHVLLNLPILLDDEVSSRFARAINEIYATHSFLNMSILIYSDLKTIAVAYHEKCIRLNTQLQH